MKKREKLLDNLAMLIILIIGWAILIMMVYMFFKMPILILSIPLTGLIIWAINRISNQ